MKSRKIIRATSLCLLILLALTLAAFAPSSNSAAQGTNLAGGQQAASVVDWQSKVDPAVLAKAALGETEFLVYMSRQADLGGAAALSSKEEKSRYVYEQLTAVAAATQPPVRQLLDSLGAEYKSFWVSNSIHVKGNMAVLEAVAKLSEVSFVYQVGKGMLKLPPQEAADASKEVTAASDPNPEPGLLKVNADDAWALGVTGQGVVVAGADTGVFWQHGALKKHYRGWNDSTQTPDHNYNWHDGIHNPNLYCPADSPEPCDDDEALGGGHGSHTVGTMVGDDGGTNRIGMAPDAQWIACRNMNNGVGTVPMYMECMEWFIAPTDANNQNPKPEKAPHVINNSWGCVEGCPPPLLQDTLQASRAAGIFYAVSAGNDGVGEDGAPGCNTIYHPLARYPEAFTVGATTWDTDSIASFSSRGSVLGDPSAPLGLVKPNITAPGVSIRSALRDGGYGSLSGTSMAGPHVAGLVALLISANPKLAGRVDRLEDIIEATATRKFTDEGCGGDTETTMPNNTYGWGRIDALAAVKDALPPVAVDDSATTIYQTPVTINVLSNDTDPDNDTLTVGGVGSAAHGTVTNNGDGTVTYTPAAGFAGGDSFTYTACAPEGCDIASDTATVNVNVSNLKDLVLSAAEITSCRSYMGTVKLHAPAPVGGQLVTIQNNNAAADFPSTVNVPAGKTMATFSYTGDPVTSKTTGNVLAKLGAATVTRSLTVKPIGVKSLTLSPNPVTNGGSPKTVTATITLECGAAPGPITFALESGNPLVATVNQSNVVIPAGSKTKTFTVTTKNVTATKTATIRATANGVTTTAKLTVNP